MTTVTVAFVVTPAPDQPDVMFEKLCREVPAPETPTWTSCALVLLDSRENA